VPHWLLVYGRLPRGPLAVLKDTMTGKTELPLNVGKSATEYLEELRKNLETAQEYATNHAEKAQQRYVSRYNLRAREKAFEIGQKVLILMRDTTSSKVFLRWIGPVVIKEKKSAHTYLVDIDGSLKHIHADKLRRYHIAVDEIVCDTVSAGHAQTRINHCAVIYDDDQDFGEIDVIEANQKVSNDNGKPQVETMPSQMIDMNLLSHLTKEQQRKFQAVLDKYSCCFSDKPGLCNVLQHEINVSEDFKPKRLRSYRVPETLKPMVEEQIQELLNLGIIRPSQSEMGSPIVCVLKGKNGKDGVRIAVDYRYLNKYCPSDAHPLPDITDLIQRVGQARYITVCDIKSAYHQLAVKPEHQWLTAFVWDGGLYEYTKAPFGQKGSGNTFARVVQHILYPIRKFTASFVDDISVYSNEFDQPLVDLVRFLQVIKESGFPLNLKKCKFAQSHVKYVGHIIGCGERKPDPERVAQ